jgi:hypothetical protein
MGRNDTSAGLVRGMKKRASEMGLDTSHFSGNRRWTDTQLCEAVLESVSWADTIRRVGVRDTGEYRAAVRRQAARLQLDISHLEPDPLPASGEYGVPMPDRLKFAAQSIALAWFQVRGHHPSVPVDHRPYDLIVEMGGKLRRVQVKTCIRPEGEVVVAPRVSGMSKVGPRVPYDPADVDMFFVVDGAATIYLIPGEAIYGKIVISLPKYGKYRVGSAGGLMAAWGDDGEEAGAVGA